MNKRYLLIGGLLTLGVATSACGLAACGNGDGGKEEVPVITETVRYTEKTNPYAELTWQEYADIDDWTDKMENADVYYQFEGSYSEAYQGNYSRDYLYMNCYVDGSVHGTVRNTANSNRIENYYGYWTNVNSRGKESLVLHILSYNNGEYNSGMYDIVCDNLSGGYYDFSSNIAISKWGTQRTMSIRGYRYSPIESLTVTTSAVSSGCIIGDAMSYSGVVVTVNRENGKSIAIDEESYTDPTCRVKFSGFDSSEAGETEVTVSYIYTDISTTYTVRVMGVKSIDVDTKDIKSEYIIGDAFITDGLVVNATRDDDVVVELDSRKYQVVKPEEWGTAGEQEITVKYGELTTTYTVKIFDVKEIEVDASAVKTEYKVGDKIDPEGLVVKATRDDDVIVNLDLSKCEIETPDGWGTPGEQIITVKFGELEKTYTVNIEAAEYTGTLNGKEASLKLNSLTDCELTVDGNKYDLGYKEVSLYGYDLTVYNLVKPEGSEIDDETWASLSMRFVIDKENGTFAKHLVYEIPATGPDGEDIKGENGENVRVENEIYDPGGNSEMRFIVFDEENETVTVSYKYWYHSNKDTFVCKYTLEDGILTFTEEVSSSVGGSGASFGRIHKVWQLHDDYTATKVTPAADES